MPVATRTSGTRDAQADLERWPADHLIDCPVQRGDEDAAAMVEHYRVKRITGKGVPHDVTDDQRASVHVMVAHCCVCGGMTYYDL